MEYSPSKARKDVDLAKILVVDDEEHITELLEMGLRYNGFEALSANDSRRALEIWTSERPDLLIIDVMLPELDGFEVVKRIRSAEGHRTPTPIIFLTAKDTTQDKIQGLSIGGDDYVTKPFSIEELIARVKAVLRRAENIPSSTPLLTIGDLEINEETREVRRGARSIELTPTEYRLLHYLVSNQRTVLSKVQLLEHIWEYDFDANASVLETYISYLRKKIDVEEPKLIHTIRGIGYSVRIPQGA